MWCCSGPADCWCRVCGIIQERRFLLLCCGISLILQRFQQNMQIPVPSPLVCLALLTFGCCLLQLELFSFLRREKHMLIGGIRYHCRESTPVVLTQRTCGYTRSIIIRNAIILKTLLHSPEAMTERLSNLQASNIVVDF